METREQMQARHLQLRVAQFNELKAELAAWDNAHNPNYVPIPQTALGRARAFLSGYLSNGGQRYTEVVESGRKANLGEGILRKAKASLRVESYKIGLLWYWRFPEPPIVSQPLTENPDPSVESQC